MRELLKTAVPGFLLATVLLMGSVGFGARTEAEEARRIVVVGGALTEVVYALGAQDRIVGVDTTSSYPPETEALAKVGYMRRLSAEGVLSLKPDLVLAAADAGPPSVLDSLGAAGVAVRTAPDNDSIDGVYEKIRFVGETLGQEDKAEALVEQVRAEMASVAEQIAAAKDAPKVLFLISAGGAPIAAGDDTSAATVIEKAGGRNAVIGFEGYKPLSMEAAVAAQPDVVLVPTHAVAMMGGEAAILARPELQATPAGREGRLVVMDGLLLLGLGPRTPEAVATLARALHPGLAVD